MGTGYPQCPYDPLTYNVSAEPSDLGQIYMYFGELVQLVRFRDAVTYVAKQALTWEKAETFEVTNDVSDSEDAEQLAGFAMMVHTEDYYGFIRVKGRLAAALKVAGDDTIAVGTPLRPHASTDGVLATYADTAASTAGNPTVTELAAITKVCWWATKLSDDPNDTVDVRFDCVNG